MTPILKVRFSAADLTTLLQSSPDYVIVTSGIVVGKINEKDVATIQVIAEGFKNDVASTPVETPGTPVQEPVAVQKVPTATIHGCPNPPCHN